jgi:hypothetical protein
MYITKLENRKEFLNSVALCWKRKVVEVVDNALANEND